MLTAGRKSSAIQSACLPRAPAWVWEGICQVKTVANHSGGAWNTDKESQVLGMRADLDSGGRAAMLRVQETPSRRLLWVYFHCVFFSFFDHPYNKEGK